MSSTVPQSQAYTDVVELCALLQCLGFSVKSLETIDGNVSTDGGVRTVVINCQSSGLNVVLESPTGISCSCPATDAQQNSGIWQVSGVTGGKQLDKEFGCTLLGSLPKAHRDRLSAELREMIKCIRQNSESDLEKQKETGLNKSASMVELSTPEKRTLQPKIDTPTRYRSLDTLTRINEGYQQLPEPGPLQRQITDDDNDIKKMCQRQSTYTICSTPGSIRLKNKTSRYVENFLTPAPMTQKEKSKEVLRRMFLRDGPTMDFQLDQYPIKSQTTILDNLIAAEKTAEELRNKLSYIIRDFADEDRNNSSISSLALDVSKISLLKGETNKAQFASSPNLSGLGTLQEDHLKSRLKRFESASTSNLAAKITPNSKPSRLRRLSPNLFKLKKDSPNVKTDEKGSDGKPSKSSMFKAKIATPVHVSRGNTESSPNLSASKKKFSHIKSTIPRLAKKE